MTESVEELKKQHRLFEEKVLTETLEKFKGKEFDEIYETILNELESYTISLKKGTVESFVEIDAMLKALFSSTEDISANQHIKLNIIQNKLKDATDYLKVKRQEILDEYKKNNEAYVGTKEYLKNIRLFSQD